MDAATNVPFDHIITGSATFVHSEFMTSKMIVIMAAGVIGTAQYAAPELMDVGDDADEGLASGSHVQIETILKSDVYR